MNKRPKIGAIVRLKQGDTDQLWLVSGHDRTNDYFMFVLAVNELECKPHLVDIGIFKDAEVATLTHQKILQKWLKTKSGAMFKRQMMTA